MRPSADWLTRAARARAAILAIANGLDGASSEQRKTILENLRDEINGNAGLWSEFKPAMEALSAGKCWYCESRENRSHAAVDHFRPKGRVAECADHPGYWWLALDPENYRYSCTYCNSTLRNESTKETLGKGVHFPLVNEALRNFIPEDTNEEFPRLLDPIVEADPGYLWFTDDGNATPLYPKERSELFFNRAETSIRVYNLNHPKISDARSLIAFEIKHQVQRGEKYLDQALAGVPDAYGIFQEAVRNLRKLIRFDSEFSAAARAFLAAYRDKDWVVSALTTT